MLIRSRKSRLIRLFSLVVAVMFLVPGFLLPGVGAAAAAPAGTALFSDVAVDSPENLYINYLVKRGMIGGFPDGTYRPGEGLTRAQVATIIA
ncbi:MAG: S-layer homology domain-containing protein, partial [Heliobacteriaceae bacterium]|nr:S-layer homology domain-containing protein [Heliobacteriaceae bacterium]